MSIPDYQSLMQPMLQILADERKRNISELHDLLCDHFALTEEEIRQRINSGRQTVMRNRVGWARTYLKKAGLILLPGRGECQITLLGQQALASGQTINNKYLKQFEDFRDFIKPSQQTSESQESEDEQTQTPEEQISKAYNSLNHSLASELLDTIKAGSPKFFEQLVVDLMVAMGYGGTHEEASQATQYTADGGIDGIIKEDRLGLETIYLQAKRYSENTVGRPAIQQFAGALDMQRARKGVFITSSRFSSEAHEYVDLIEKKIILIDGQQLAELMIEHNLGVSSKETYQIKALDSDYFNEE